MAKRNYSTDLYDRIDVSGTIEIADAETGGNVGSIGTIRVASIIRIGDQITINLDLRNIDTTGLTAGNDLWIRGIPFSPDNSAVAVGHCHISPTTFTGNPELYQSQGSYGFRVFDSSSVVTALIVSEVTSGSTDIFGTLSYVALPSDIDATL